MSHRLPATLGILAITLAAACVRPAVPAEPDAIIALERMTGTRLDYCYHDPEPQRRQAVQRWREYLASGAATQPAGRAE